MCTDLRLRVEVLSTGHYLLHFEHADGWQVRRPWILTRQGLKDVARGLEEEEEWELAGELRAVLADPARPVR